MELRSEPMSGVGALKGVWAGGDCTTDSPGLDGVPIVCQSRDYWVTRRFVCLFTWRPGLNTDSPKLRTLPARNVVVAFDFQTRALVTCMPLSTSFKRARDRGISSFFTPTEMVPKNVTIIGASTSRSLPKRQKHTCV